MHMKTKSFLFAVIAMLLANCLQAQSRLILNGAVVNIQNGAYLVIDNSATNAITRNSGYILSEGENNRIKWNAGTTAGTYTVPFGHSGLYLPVSFGKSGGTGSGSFVFSTYRTGWKNSDNLPAGVAGMGGQMPDHSHFAIDRFWQVSAEGYTAKPSLTNLVFTYADAEHQAAGNSIFETNLRAQQYNTMREGWDPMQAGGTINNVTNQVTVVSVASGSQFKWWTLIDQLYPLPVHLLSFTAAASGKAVRTAWNVNTETPGVRYVLQRSKTGYGYEDITTMFGTGSAGERHYTYRDTIPFTGQSFYRVRMDEPNKQPAYSAAQAVWLKQPVDFLVYPNPVTGNEFTVLLPQSLQAAGFITLVHPSGKIVATYTIAAGQKKLTVYLPPSLPAGVYWCRLQTTEGTVLQQAVTIY